MHGVTGVADWLAGEPILAVAAGLVLLGCLWLVGPLRPAFRCDRCGQRKARSANSGRGGWSNWCNECAGLPGPAS